MKQSGFPFQQPRTHLHPECPDQLLPPADAAVQTRLSHIHRNLEIKLGGLEAPWGPQRLQVGVFEIENCSIIALRLEIGLRRGY
ncbi:hypothetical protein ACMD2_17386 [Ananas comosus]|uniref:Uncharacterized protein n=1 Tax=Ananas comosus TaxID=4615 RepID=A0A199VQ13_ANACO|nr:hypothetical protein ACMD2_17386 [Ananas comosus]